ncbi:hypothetical protein A3L10_02665 [Thermococcus radiotolerans]|uniref:Uncharacterized protein n=2 Tax=Thermococcus radiotolerans TaxID=187880 RepID=A0A2Z2MZJ7_9EURY|nr:hypothetical protein A3L10_02665 [Thermococcus radiotolerans]
MKRWALIIALILVLSLVPGWAVKPAVAGITEETIYPTDDVYVYEKYPDSNENKALMLIL